MKSFKIKKIIAINKKGVFIPTNNNTGIIIERVFDQITRKVKFTHEIIKGSVYNDFVRMHNSYMSKINKFDYVDETDEIEKLYEKPESYEIEISLNLKKNIFELNKNEFIKNKIYLFESKNKSYVKIYMENQYVCVELYDKKSNKKKLLYRIDCEHDFENWIKTYCKSNSFIEKQISYDEYEKNNYVNYKHKQYLYILDVSCNDENVNIRLVTVLVPDEIRYDFEEYLKMPKK